MKKVKKDVSNEQEKKSKGTGAEQKEKRGQLKSKEGTLKKTAAYRPKNVKIGERQERYIFPKRKN